MSKIPSLSYTKIIANLQHDGWVKVCQKGSHIRLDKKVSVNENLKITVPAHRTVKRSTLSHSLKQAQIELEYFLELL